MLAICKPILSTGRIKRKLDSRNGNSVWLQQLKREGEGILANYASSQVSRSISARFTILFCSRANSVFTFFLFHLYVSLPVNLAYLFGMKLFETELAERYPNRLKLTESEHLLCAKRLPKLFKGEREGGEKLGGETVCRPRVLLAPQTYRLLSLMCNFYYN